MLKILYRKEVPKLAQNCIIFSAKLIFSGGKPPQLERAQPLPRPHPFTFLNIYPPTFNLTPTPLFTIKTKDVLDSEWALTSRALSVMWL